MTLGAMTWTCLLLTAAAAPTDVWHMNQKAFQIPIRFDAQRRAEIKELDLWVSHDRGQTWNLAGRATPDKEFFPYAVTEDGPYWFTMAVIDLKGKQEPANVMTAPVGQKIEVDTVKPDIKFTADRQGEEIRVTWAITEAHPNPETLKLEYAETAEGPWTALPIKPGPNGDTKFQNPSAVVVRMQMQDLAENVGEASKQVPAVAGAVAFVPPPPPVLTSPGPSSPPALGPLPPPGPGPLPLPPPPPADLHNGSPLEKIGDTVGTWNPRVADQPHLPPPPPIQSPTPPVLPPDGLPTTPPPAATPGPGPTPIAIGTRAMSGAQTVAFSSAQQGATPMPAPPGAPTPDSPAALLRGALPPLQIVNKRQLKMEFDVGKFGPSGLGGVDVYVTTDDGATWEKSPVDPNASLPTAADVHPGGGAVRGSVMVQLPKEGVGYGFYVVVKSRAGLGKPPPHTGDSPQLRVELDTTPPEASLFQPQPDPRQRDTLILTWQATDKNLATNPVTLEWSAQPGPDAQWNYIGEAAELPNTGRYAWPIKGNVPPMVYLRLTVRDVAGNKAVAQTTEPVLIDLSVPEVSNIGLGGIPQPGAGQPNVGQPGAVPVGIGPAPEPRFEASGH